MNDPLGLNTEFDTDQARYYFVGNLMRQDTVGRDNGYRERLQCPCHSTPMQVFGPRNVSDGKRYIARCKFSELEVTANTPEELWAAAVTAV